MITISRLYDNYDAAARAVAELERAGIPHSDISIIANNADGWYDRDRTTSRTAVLCRTITGAFSSAVSRT